MPTDKDYMAMAVAKVREGIAAGQTPFGAVIVDKGGIVIANAHNTVWRTTDPTAHGEVNAIREAARSTGSIDLGGSTMYTTCEPCPMCLTATHWAKVKRVVYGAEIEDAAKAGFDELYVSAREMVTKGRSPLIVESGLLRDECRKLFDEWLAAGKSRKY
jgi:guanine deaminase